MSLQRVLFFTPRSEDDANEKSVHEAIHSAHNAGKLVKDLVTGDLLESIIWDGIVCKSKCLKWWISDDLSDHEPAMDNRRVLWPTTVFSRNVGGGSIRPIIRWGGPHGQQKRLNRSRASDNARNWSAVTCTTPLFEHEDYSRTLVIVLGGRFGRTPMQEREAARI